MDRLLGLQLADSIPFSRGLATGHHAVFGRSHRQEISLKTSPPVITVVGSVNMDLVVRCPTLPQPGQTLMAHSSAEICGGKGANQAVAAARAGGRATMVGRVGDDAFADSLVGNLESSGVNCSHIRPTEGCASGLAVVAVADNGQNSIMVVPGANGRITVDDIQAARHVIQSSDIVLLQLEIPINAVVETIQLARSAGVRVMLDPAPVPAHFPDELLHVDVLCPNQTEAAALAGHDIVSLEQAIEAGRILGARGARRVAVTLGDRGTVLVHAGDSRRVAPFSVRPVDTTAAGDAFAGSLAVRWVETGDFPEAVRFANAAGALCASRMGAQPGMATRAEIEALLANG